MPRLLFRQMQLREGRAASQKHFQNGNQNKGKKERHVNGQALEKAQSFQKDTDRVNDWFCDCMQKIHKGRLPKREPVQDGAGQHAQLQNTEQHGDCAADQIKQCLQVYSFSGQFPAVYYDKLS